MCKNISVSITRRRIRIHAHGIHPEKHHMRRFVIAERVDQLDIRYIGICCPLLECGTANLRKSNDAGIVRTHPSLLPDRIIHVGKPSVHISAPAIRPLPVARHDENGIFVVIQISRHRKPELFESVDAGNRPRLFPRRIQSRQQHSGQYRDDRNRNEELYKGKSPFPVFHFPFLLFYCFMLLANFASRFLHLRFSSQNR